MNNQHNQAPTNDLYQIAEQYLLSVIRMEHPEWIEKDGGCKKCMDYYDSLEHAVKIKS